MDARYLSCITKNSPSLLFSLFCYLSMMDNFWLQWQLFQGCFSVTETVAVTLEHYGIRVNQCSPLVVMGHQASWHWLVAFVGPAWPCSSAESGYCGHWFPTVFLSVVVGEDICSSPLNIVPEIQESVRKTISFALFVAWTILILLDAHKLQILPHVHFIFSVLF